MNIKYYYEKSNGEKNILVLETGNKKYDLKRYKKDIDGNYISSDTKEVFKDDNNIIIDSLDGTIYNNEGLITEGDPLVDGRKTFNQEETIKKSIKTVHTNNPLVRNLNAEHTSIGLSSISEDDIKQPVEIDIRDQTEEEKELIKNSDVIVNKVIRSNKVLGENVPGVISSSMGSQDIEAVKNTLNWKNDTDDDLLFKLANAGTSLLNVGNIAKDIDTITSVFTGKSLLQQAGLHPKDNNFDLNNKKINDLKGEISKEVPITNYKESAYYSNFRDVNGIKNRLYRGNLTENLIDPNYYKSKYGKGDIDESADDTSDLVMSSEANMYTSRPGHTILAKDDAYNVIDNSLSLNNEDELRKKLGANFNSIPDFRKQIVVGENKTNYSPLNLNDAQSRIINILKNKNTYNKQLGYIHVKPFYDEENKFNVFNIPFEFKPQISEGATTAKYQAENLLGRIGPMQVYTGTDPSTITISTEYKALAPDDSEEGAANQFSVNAWEYYWTNRRIEEIELKLRSLVFPVVNNEKYLLRPPIIQIKLIGETQNASEDSSIGFLYKYPHSDGAGLENYLKISPSSNVYKKYIVTSVQIEDSDGASLVCPSIYKRRTTPLENTEGDGINSYIGYENQPYSRRREFKVSMQCMEVTENFLDIIPDFKAYYNSWTNLENKDDKYYNNSDGILKSALKITSTEIEDALTAQSDTLALMFLSKEEKNKEKIKRAYNLGECYCYPERLKEQYENYLSLLAFSYNKDYYNLLAEKEATFIKDVNQDYITDFVKNNKTFGTSFCKPKYFSDKYLKEPMTNIRIKSGKGSFFVNTYSTQFDFDSKGLIYHSIGKESYKDLNIINISDKLSLFPKITKAGNGIAYNGRNYKLSNSEQNEIWESKGKNTTSRIVFIKDEINQVIKLFIINEENTASETCPEASGEYYTYFNYKDEHLKNKIWMQASRKENCYFFMDNRISKISKIFNDFDTYELNHIPTMPNYIKNNELLGMLSNTNTVNYLDGYLYIYKNINQIYKYINERIENNWFGDYDEHLTKEENQIKKDYKKLLSFVEKIKSSIEKGENYYTFTKDDVFINYSLKKNKFVGLDNLYNIFQNSINKEVENYEILRSNIEKLFFEPGNLTDIKRNKLIVQFNKNALIADSKEDGKVFFADKRSFKSYSEILQYIGYAIGRKNDFVPDTNTNKHYLEPYGGWAYSESSLNPHMEELENVFESDKKFVIDQLKTYEKYYGKNADLKNIESNNNNNLLGITLKNLKTVDLKEKITKEGMKNEYEKIMKEKDNFPEYSKLSDENKNENNFYNLKGEDNKLIITNEAFQNYIYYGGNGNVITFKDEKGNITNKTNKYPLTSLGYVKEDESNLGIDYEGSLIKDIFEASGLKEEAEKANQAVEEEKENIYAPDFFNV